jgi:hypothetical protein
VRRQPQTETQTGQGIGHRVDIVRREVKLRQDNLLASHRYAEWPSMAWT